MPASLKRILALLCVSGLAALAAEAPLAGDGVTVNVNMARILRINSPAATVIIGNPGIADVTIQDPKTLILTGKAFGETNLIILDAIGNPIADTLISVVAQDANQLTVYQGTARTTLICDPVCEATPMLGDDPSFTSQAIASSNLIGTAAAGSGN